MLLTEGVGKSLKHLDMDSIDQLQFHWADRYVSGRVLKVGGKCAIY